MLSCILLSAGLSSRFGSPKALIPIDQQTVLEHLQTALLSLKLKEIIIVLGHNADKIEPFVFKHKKVNVVHNKNYKLGQTSSLKAGLRKVSQDSTGIMLLPVDYPFTQPRTLAHLITIFKEDQPMFLIPTYHGKRGHPLFFRSSLQKLFLTMKNSEGANAVIHQHAAQVTLVPVDDPGVVATFNTPGEFEKIKKELSWDAR